MNRVIKKVCLLGEESVGKTSLVQRFVYDRFSEVYKSTIGVSLSKKTIVSGSTETVLMVWDLEGNSEPSRLPQDYMRGAHFALAVADLSRPETMAKAALFSRSFLKLNPHSSCILALNKSDLMPGATKESFFRELPDSSEFETLFMQITLTSAKTGGNTDVLFNYISGGAAE